MLTWAGSPCHFFNGRTGREISDFGEIADGETPQLSFTSSTVSEYDMRMSASNLSPERSATPDRGKHPLLWLGLCVVAGLLLAPLFYAMPPRMKLLGLHAWALSAGVGVGCAWLAVQQGIRSRVLIGCVSVLISLGAQLLLAHWGYAEFKQASARRMPMLPLPQQVGSPEEMTRSLEMQQELKQAMVPSFTDFQRRRMNSRMLKRIRPLALWGGELLLAGVVAGVVSGAYLATLCHVRPEAE